MITVLQAAQKIDCETEYVREFRYRMTGHEWQENCPAPGHTHCKPTLCIETRHWTPDCASAYG